MSRLRQSALPILAVAVACSPASGPSGIGASGGGGDGGGEPEFRSSVRGQAVDEDGGPLASLAVTLCAEICLVSITDESGEFLFEQVRPAQQVLENLGYPGTDQAASALVHTRFFDVVPVGVDEQIVLDRPYVVYKVVDPKGPLAGAQQLSLSGGLEVSFDADLFGTDDNLLPAPAEAVHFGAVELPKKDWPTGGLGSWTVLRAWGMAVWDLHHEDAFAVVAPLAQAGPLPAGTEVGFLTADYTHGFLNGIFFEEAGELTADGTAIRTPVAAGLDRSTLWLAVARLNP